MVEDTVSNLVQVAKRMSSRYGANLGPAYRVAAKAAMAEATATREKEAAVCAAGKAVVDKQGPDYDITSDPARG